MKIYILGIDNGDCYEGENYYFKSPEEREIFKSQSNERIFYTTEDDLENLEEEMSIKEYKTLFPNAIVEPNER